MSGKRTLFTVTLTGEQMNNLRRGLGEAPDLDPNIKEAWRRLKYAWWEAQDFSFLDSERTVGWSDQDWADALNMPVELYKDIISLDELLQGIKPNNKGAAT